VRLAFALCAGPAGRLSKESCSSFGGEPLRAVMNLSTVFVGNVPFEANENSIREIFKIIGPVRTFW
jgi:RNA recognition motif-containing protein